MTFHSAKFLGLAWLVMSCTTKEPSPDEGRVVGANDAGKGAGGAPSGTGGASTTGAGGENLLASGGGPGSGGAKTVNDAGDSGCGTAVEGGFLGGARDTVAVDMATICAFGRELECGRNAEQLLEGYVCAVGPDPAGSATPFIRKNRTVGCGLETIGWNGGYGGPSQTFALSTHALVAASLSSDANFGPCNAFRYVAGVPVLPCPEAVTYTCTPAGATDGGVGPSRGCRAPTDPGCSTCCRFEGASSTCQILTLAAGGTYGVSSSPLGPCDPNCAPCAACLTTDEQALRALPERFDCDCSIAPGIDPCFGPRTCGCWCSQFKPLAQKCAGVP